MRSDRGEVALVLLHRTPDSSRMWLDVAPCFGERWRTIAIDTPGFGESDAPAAAPEIADYAQIVIDVLDRLGIERAHLLAHRTGSTIAVEVAARFPERVGRLVVSGLVNYPPDDRRPTIEVAMSRELLPDGSHYTKRWEATRRAWPWATPEQIHRSVVDSLAASATWQWAGEAVRRYDLDARAAIVAAPTLLLYGETDRFTAWIPQLLATLPNARAHVFPNGHDLTMLQFPDEFCRVVTEFLEEGGQHD